MSDWKVTFVQYNEERNVWWTGMKEHPPKGQHFTKYISLPVQFKIGEIVTELAEGKYEKKRYQMEPFVSTIVTKKGSALSLERQVKEQIERYRDWGYVISGFNVVPALGVVSEDGDKQAFYLIVQATLKRSFPEGPSRDEMIPAQGEQHADQDRTIEV